MRTLAVVTSAWVLSLLLSGGSGEVVGSCGGAEPSTVKDCQNVDYGSCGNACCNLEFEVTAENPTEVAKLLFGVLKHGGPDGQYSIQETDGGVAGFENLTGFSSSLPWPFTNSSVFIAQAHHVTAVHKYVDTINFNLRPSRAEFDRGTVIHAFSSSLIAGALGDNGQNYKNIAMLIKAVPWRNPFINIKHLDNSCAVPNMAANPRILAASQSMPVKLIEAVPAALKLPPVEGTCGQAGSKVKDCDHVDFGSCGNACCGLVFQVPDEPSVAIQKLNSTFATGGPDGAYTLQQTAHGTLGFFNLTGFVDKLPEPFHSSTNGVYIGQAHHMTSGPKHYNDTISFHVIENDIGNGSLIHALSLSLIGGALGDRGQNYKNIAMAMKASFTKSLLRESSFGSCPAPSAREIVV